MGALPANINAASARLPHTYEADRRSSGAYRNARQVRSKVYFIFDEVHRAVKIGTAMDVASRLSSLQVGNAVPLRVVRVVDGGRPTELWFHKKFASKRLSGEWFLFDADMLSASPPDEIPVRAVSRPRLQLTLRELLNRSDEFDIGGGQRAKLLSILANVDDETASGVLELIRQFVRTRAEQRGAA